MSDNADNEPPPPTPPPSTSTSLSTSSSASTPSQFAAENASLLLTSELRRSEIETQVSQAKAALALAEVKLDRQKLKNGERVHTFWNTQPVSKETGGAGGDGRTNNVNSNSILEEEGVNSLLLTPSESSVPSETYNELLIHQTHESIRTEPYPLPPGFTWSTVDPRTEKGLDEIYNLLNKNYVEDDDNMFRFDYSKEFLMWALTPPTGEVEWIVGVRGGKDNKLMAIITGIGAHIKVTDKVSDVVQSQKTIKMAEINFLCIHKKLRSKRLAPVLIKEVTRRINLTKVYTAVYTAGIRLPGVIGSSRYYHRMINFKKLVEVNFCRVPQRSTMGLQVKLNKCLPAPVTPGFRVMVESDCVQACALLNNYLEKFKVHPVFDLAEFKHWLLPREGVINTYVCSENSTNNITDLCSFYHLPSTVINNPKHNKLNAAYSYYNVATSTTLPKLVNDMISMANKEKQDVFNCLNIMDNSCFLEQLKFGEGDGNLQYYLYNWKSRDVTHDEIGLVLL